MQIYRLSKRSMKKGRVGWCTSWESAFKSQWTFMSEESRKVDGILCAAWNLIKEIQFRPWLTLILRRNEKGEEAAAIILQYCITDLDGILTYHCDLSLINRRRTRQSTTSGTGICGDCSDGTSTAIVYLPSTEAFLAPFSFSHHFLTM